MGNIKNNEYIFSRLGIAKKIAGLSFLSAIFIAAVSIGTALFMDFLLFQSFQKNHIETLSNILANSSAAAIRFQDEDTAQEHILTLLDEKDITRAQIFDKSGQAFASHSKRGDPQLQLNINQLGMERNGDVLINRFPIRFSGRIIGYGLIENSGESLKKQAIIKSLWSLVVIPIALLIAALLYQRFKFLIANPILRLTEVSTEVSKSKNYALRAKRRYSDEVGQLVDNFNMMLAQIEDQDRQLNDANRFLENQVYERTKELVQAVQDAQNALKAKSRFLSTMSHELRTPMNAVIGMSSLISTDQMDEETGEAVEIIKKSSIHLGSMIDDILDFSKIESGKLELERHAFNLQSCIEDAVNVCSYRFQKKNVHVLSDIKSNLPEYILGDETRLRQILINLIGNAIKFTKEGFVTVVARTRFGNQGQNLLKIVVSDTGVGISEAKLQLLFSDFVQADSSTTREFGGTGLGLSISKQLTEAMGGEIFVKSSPGKGSDFWIEIPYEADELIGSESRKVDFSKLNYRCEGLPELMVEKLHDYCKTMGVRAFDPESMTKKPILLFKAALNMNIQKNIELIESDSKRDDFVIPVYVCTQNHLDEIRSFNDVRALPIPLTMASVRSLIEAIPEDSYKEYIVEERDSFSKLKDKRILLVEDNRMNIKVVQLLLGRLGLKCDALMNGKEARDTIQSGNHYDLILMDYQMPVMDGIEATRRIREMDLQTQPWIIALTANVEEDISKEMFRAGINAYVSKPIHKSKMVRALQDFEYQMEASDISNREAE